MRTYRPIALVLLVFSVSLACSALQPSTAPDTGAVETSVAATFTAIAPGEPSSTAKPTESVEPPTEMPEITPEPAGLQVVYAQNGIIYRWREGEQPKGITSSGGPIYSLDLSDDGQLVAFTRYVGDIQAELWAVNIDGSDERVLVSEADFSTFDPDALAVVPYHFSWVPDSHILAYNTNQVFEGPRPGLYEDLRLVDADTMTQSTLLTPGQGGGFNYSPDGSQIAISTPSTISLVNSDGSNFRPTVLRYEPVLTYSEYQYYAQPQWSGDSSGLKVIIPPVDALSDPRPPTTLWEIPIDGSPAVKTGEIVTMPFFANSAVFSPDLMKIGYLIETGDPTQNIHELHFVNPDGTGDQTYHAEALLNFAGWATDSLHFAMTSGENQSLELGSLDTPYQPGDNMSDSVYRLTWIDGERYLFMQASENGATLYLASISGEPIKIDQMDDGNAPFDFHP